MGSRASADAQERRSAPAPAREHVQDKARVSDNCVQGHEEEVSRQTVGNCAQASFDDKCSKTSAQLCRTPRIPKPPSVNAKMNYAERGLKNKHEV
jgi:hypothetical protein